MEYSEALNAESSMQEFDYLPRRNFGTSRWSRVIEQIVRFTCPHLSCNMSIPVTAPSLKELNECPECGNKVDYSYGPVSGDVIVYRPGLD